VFDAVTAMLTAGLLGKHLLAEKRSAGRLFPTRSLLAAWLFCVPCVAFSQFPLLSLTVVALTFGLHTFFLLCLAELGRERGFERLVLLLSLVLIAMALALFADRFLQLNLSLRGSNLNQLTYLGGLQIYRAGGFFQDPQAAGACLACLITFLLVLSIRGRFRSGKMRLLVWFAVLAGLAALPTTVARGAMLSCLFVSAAAVFAFNAWSPHLKLAVMAGALVIAAFLAQLTLDPLLEVLPATLSERFLNIGDALNSRIAIWFDTWDMFAEHPLTGIGPGSFREYLLATRPGLFNYYGIGSATGVPYIPDQPESGYLTILYEGGVLGSIAALLIAGDAIRRALAVIAAEDSSADARTETIAALAGLTAFAITFTTLFTLSEPRVGAVFAFFLAVIWYRSSMHRSGEAHV
jgi:O-antigen ligase